MTFNQVKKLILQQCDIQTDEKSFDDMVMKILYSKDKANERELIFQRIEELKSKGNDRSQCACFIRYEFAKSKRHTYRLIKESKCYE
jgi:dihydropteroate synthase